jgi:phosphoribosylanthranilate isomerase
MTMVKLCGMTRADDVALACELGADAVGFVLWPRSPRCVSFEDLARLVENVPAATTTVGVLVRPQADELERAVDAGLRVLQIHDGLDRTWDVPVPLWLAAHVGSDISAAPADVPIVLDAHDPERHGGTGRTIDWSRAAALAAMRRVVLAGGLTSANVATAIRQVRPYGVDVASGIETRPGIKDAHAMRQFMAAVREADR